MKKALLLVWVLIIEKLLLAQAPPTKFYIQFTDKNNSPYSLSAPGAFLSQRAINRRINQGYSLDIRDIPVNQQYVDSVLAVGNVALLNKTKWLNGVTIYTADTAVLSQILQLSFVQSIVPIYVPQPKGSIHAGKHDKELFQLMKLSADKNVLKSTKSYNYGFSANQIEMIGLDFLHNQGYNGQGLLIAVLDAGFFSVDTMAVFDSLRNDNRILGAMDFVDHNGNVYESHTHGMMVLSLMAGNVPGQLIGTAPRASFWLLRSEDGPTENVIEEYNWVSAAEFADSLGADIINSSLGYSEFDDTTQNHVFADLDGNTTVVSRGANAAASRGILVVNSAGNSAQTSWQRIIAPSDADSVLTIGAVDENEVYAPFSSVGYTADGRVKPDVASQGANTIVASTQGGIMTGNGTSFSAPIISGAVACLWQAHPNASNLQVIDAIKQSASHYNAPDSLTGYGIPNFAVADMLLNNVNIPSDEFPLQVSIFPNPFTESFSVIFFSNDTQSLSLDLFDINGRKVTAEYLSKTNVGFNSVTFQNAEKISKGMYLLRIIYKEKTTFYKLVKIS